MLLFLQWWNSYESCTEFHHCCCGEQGTVTGVIIFGGLHFQQLHSTYARCESSGSRQAVQCCPLLKGVCEHVAQTFWGTWTWAASRSSAGAPCRRPGFNFCCLLFCYKSSAVNPCLQNLLQKELGLRHTHLHVHTNSGLHCTSNTNTKGNI